MKKLVLTSVTVLLISISSFAQDGSSCSKKCEKKCESKECMKDGTCTKKCDRSACAYQMTATCNPETSKECAKKCQMEEGKEKNAETK